jgi:integrase
MARDKGHLTDLQLRHWIKAGKPLAKADGDGLTFTLSAAGVAGWILRYRHGGRRRELTIGRYPDIGLAEARGIATLKRAEVQQGRNPAAEKLQGQGHRRARLDGARPGQGLPRQEAGEPGAQHAGERWPAKNLNEDRRVEKKLGALTVREIEASDVVALIEGAGLTWGESNMLLITTKCLFTHACGERLINANPCHGIMFSALLGERPLNPGSAPAPDADARGTEAAAGRAHPPPDLDELALAIRILLATAVRSAELYQAKWADVDLDGAQWHIPKSKTGAAMDSPLTHEVVDWFRELRTLSGNSAYVLPAHSRSRAARHGGDTHLNKDTLREATKQQLTERLRRQIRCSASDATPAIHRQGGTARAGVSEHHPAQQAPAEHRYLPPRRASGETHGFAAILA